MKRLLGMKRNRNQEILTIRTGEPLKKHLKKVWPNVSKEAIKLLKKASKFEGD